jgi:hypothetical protein
VSLIVEPAKSKRFTPEFSSFNVIKRSVLFVELVIQYSFAESSIVPSFIPGTKISLISGAVGSYTHWLL